MMNYVQYNSVQSVWFDGCAVVTSGDSCNIKQVTSMKEN